MSVISLRTQIREDHLTCSICYEHFEKPKALPCLHTFCENCLRDYVVGRGYENLGLFPCPVCRSDTSIPNTGIQGFPDNHLMSSLSHTVDRSAPVRPVPKPRRSLGQSIVTQDTASSDISTSNEFGIQDSGLSDNVLNSDYAVASRAGETEMATAQAPALPEKSCRHDDLNNDLSGMSLSNSNVNSGMTTAQQMLPPPYSSVADTRPDLDNVDNESDWAIVPKQQPPEGTSVDPSSTTAEYCVVSVSTSNQLHPSSQPTGTSVAGPITVPDPNPALIGWNLPPFISMPQSPAYTAPQHTEAGDRTFNTHTPREFNPQSVPRPVGSVPIYPTVPPTENSNNTACSENLMLKFGKQGASVRDFLKPIGLTITREGHYVISDTGGDQHRIFVYNSGGELTTAFRVGCRVKDLTMTKDNEILAAVKKQIIAIRHFTLGGQCKGEYGKFFTYEVPCGIAMLGSGGAVLTGTQNHCVYVLTNQMKLAVKFGRKGKGDGYFSHPSYVAVNSKNQIIVTDKVNNNVQIFNADGKFKHRFHVTRGGKGQLSAPLGVCVDNKDNIVVADSGNHSVEVFTSQGQWLSTVVRDTHLLGENVKPVNVAVTPTGKVAVLLRGPYFAEMRVYTSRHQAIPQHDGHSPRSKLIKSSRCW